MTSIQIHINSEVKQVYDLLLALRVKDTQHALYEEAQLVGLMNLIREHVPMVLVSRFPENQLIARAFEVVKTEGGAA